MKWHIVNYALPLTTLSLVTANTYVYETRKNNMEGTINASSLATKLTWAIEMYDLYKDWRYFFMFPHIFIARIILAFSLTFPFARANQFEKSSDRSVCHNFLLFMGITQSEEEKQVRLDSMLEIAVFENIP